MQVYKAPLKDYKFLIKDFLNSSLSESVLKNSLHTIRFVYFLKNNQERKYTIIIKAQKKKCFSFID